jgi:hypothetical protein
VIGGYAPESSLLFTLLLTSCVFVDKFGFGAIKVFPCVVAALCGVVV